MLTAKAKEPSHGKARPEAGAQDRAAREKAAVNPVWQQLAMQLPPAGAQARLAVGAEDDPSEREADRVADRVTSMKTPAADGGRLSLAPARFRKAQPGRDRQQEEEEEAGSGQRGQGSVAAPPVEASRDGALLREPGRPLDPATRDFFERRFGQDFGHVRVHTDEDSARQAESIQANAFTLGADIVFNRERFRPETDGGRRLLAHELAHVVQQGSATPAHGGRGAAAAYATLIRRDRFRRVAAETPRTPAQIRAMRVSEFNSLATRQLDWATSPHLTAPAAAPDLAAFREILNFSREPNILDACGEMLIDDLMTAPAGVPGLFAPLRHYSRGASLPRTTAWLRTTDNVATAVGWGNDLASLEAASDPATLRMTMPQPAPLGTPSAFEQLVTGGFIADFVDFLNRCHPVLSATDGWEVVSYVALRGEGANPVTYLGRINYVRDYHHFTRAALDRLAANEAVTTADQQNPRLRRPLTLVLHTTIDHNHAFHRTAGMTGLINDPRILTIVVEGLPTLGDYQSRIAPVAARYGIGGRVAQVLIAGHGSATVVGMAGTVTAGAVQEQVLTNAGNPADVASTESLVRALVAVMSTDPALRRVALAACLTASHSVTSPVDPNNPATAAAQITAAINANPNIRDFLQSLMGAGSTVIGVPASQPAQTFLDPAGRVALNVPDDPRIMGTVLEYVEFGTEPGGALRAVVEGWAADHSHTPPATLTLDAMTRRLGSPNAGIDWYEQSIRGIYDRAVNQYWNNGAMINWFTGLAGFLAHMYFAEDGQATTLWAWFQTLPAADINGIFTRLTGSRAWANQPRIRLLLNQVWMRHDPARGAQFLAELAAFANCGAAARYVDMNVVRPQIASLLTLPPPAAPDPGQLRLALMEAAANPLPSPPPAVLPPHVVFLRALLGAAPRFPAALDIGVLTSGLTSEDEVLTAIGRSPAGAVPSGQSVPPAELPRANVDLDRDGTNDFYLEPLTASGTVVNCHSLHVRSRPWMGDTVRDVIAAGTVVRVIGQHRGWYGIEHRGRVRFVYGAFIQVP
jgi:hypothetical protein